MSSEHHRPVAVSVHTQQIPLNLAISGDGSPHQREARPGPYERPLIGIGIGVDAPFSAACVSFECRS